MAVDQEERERERERERENFHFKFQSYVVHSFFSVVGSVALGYIIASRASVLLAT